ncbi:MAG: hypothetical protein JWP37_779 [Mucilaginibacter sp.]|nr:hypothetical protein [Mucilaginibacter sp.]
MALIIVLIGTYIIYLINRKKFIDKTNAQKIAKLGIYALCMLLGMFVFFEILHLIKYHSFNL